MIEQIILFLTIFVAINILTIVPCAIAAYTPSEQKLLKLRWHEIKHTYFSVWIVFIISLITIVFLSWLHVKYTKYHTGLCAITDTIESLLLSYVAGFIFFQVNDFIPKTKEKFDAINGIYSCLHIPLSIFEELLLQNTQSKDIILDRDDFIAKFCDKFNIETKDVKLIDDDIDYLTSCCENINNHLQRAQNSYHGYISLKYAGAINSFACCNDDIKNICVYGGYNNLSNIYDALKKIHKETVEYQMDIIPYISTHNM